MTFPTGTVTFLFTDIESRSKLWEEYPQVMNEALAHHDAILRETVESGQGFIIKITGDGVYAVFSQQFNQIKPDTEALRYLEAALAKAESSPDFTAADAIRRENNSLMTAVEQPEYDTELSAIQDAAGDDLFQTAWQHGQRMNLDQAIAYALTDQSDASGLR